MKRILRIGAGVALLILGIAGLVLPVLQGWLFIFLGLSLIAPKFSARLKRKVFGRLFKKEIFIINEWKRFGTSAGFTTRRFPLLLKNTDELLEPENQKKFTSFLKQPSQRFVLLNQVHEDKVAVLDEPIQFKNNGFYHISKADAAITNIQGLIILVFTADCLPVFFQAGKWVGLVHAGWRGTHQKISQKTLRLICDKSGTAPENVKVFFGPCIGVKSYEVGEEFKAYFPESSFEFKNNHCYFDITKENQRQLVESGVDTRNILNHGLCTFEEKESFYSFRREKEGAGRMISFISVC